MEYFKNKFSQGKGIKFIITVLIIFAIFFTVSNRLIIFAAENNMKSVVKEGDDLMGKRNLDSYEKALVKYKSALAAEPDNIDYMFKTSNALIHIMRVLTCGNTVKIDGTTQDDEKNKKIWAKYGPDAVKFAEAVYKKRPNDAAALNAYTESYMYYSSSFGIIQAIFKGAAGQYKENAFALIKCCPKLDDAIGDIYMGAFYVAAPWPLSDLGEARKHIKKVVELCPDSVRGHHYKAMVEIKDGNYEAAKKDLNYVLGDECTMGPEHDYCGWLKDQAKRGLAIIEEKRK
jgi:tetratricopeptide (TPR) repeat protein